MKNGFRIKKIGVSVMLAVVELLLGISLLIDAVGLSSIVIIVLGVLLILAGGYHLFRYARMPREEATQTWALAAGGALLAAGITAIANQHWLVQILGTLTALYGLLLLAATFMKLQIAVDAFRGKRTYWYLMAISFAATAVMATLLLLQVFPGSAVWIVTGIVLLLLAVLDVVYFFLGHPGRAKEKEEEKK